MRSIGLAASGFLIASSLAIADTDYACMNRCTALGSSYAYCQNVCSYSGARDSNPYSQLRDPAEIAANYARSLQQARENQLRQNEDARARQLADAQQALIAEQTEALRLETERRQREAATVVGGPSQTVAVTERPSQADQEAYQRWIAAAIPRAGRFADFDAVVFAPDVQITPAMIDWMSHSKYAADIAYYLGKHNGIASLIARQTREAMAETLAGIEREISLSEKK